MMSVSLLVEEIGVSEENYRPAIGDRNILIVVFNTPHHR